MHKIYNLFIRILPVRKLANRIYVGKIQTLEMQLCRHCIY